MALFRRKSKSTRETLANDPFDVDFCMSIVNNCATQWENRDVEPELECARLCDRLRDAEVRPPALDEFDVATTHLTDDDWRRFAMCTQLIANHDPQTVSVLCEGNSRHILRQFVEIAMEKRTHTMELLRQSDIRQEEFVRTFAAKFQWPITDEEDAESKERLGQIDYARLLKEADEAKGNAQERMAYLQQLQKQESMRQARRRRGKW